jgi:hypothetical protein
VSVIIAILTSNFITAASFSCEKQEAQIIATVSYSDKVSMTSCLAKIKIEGVRIFNAHVFCPLNLEEIIEAGIEVGFRNGHECRLSAGDEINGIVFKDKAGKIVLEN